MQQSHEGHPFDGARQGQRGRGCSGLVPLLEGSSAVLLEKCSGVAPAPRSSCSPWDGACSRGKASEPRPNQECLYDIAPQNGLRF